MTSPWLSGTPDANRSFTDRRAVYFFTKDVKVAESYARGDTFKTSSFRTFSGPKQPTVFTCELHGLHALDFHDQRVVRTWDERRRTFNAHVADPDERLPSSTSQGFLCHSGHPSFAWYPALLDLMPEYNSCLLDEGSQGVSLATCGVSIKIVSKRTL